VCESDRKLGRVTLLAEFEEKGGTKEKKRLEGFMKKSVSEERPKI